MEREVWVHAELGGSSLLVGRLWSRLRTGRESATFQYEEDWLNHPDKFALEPALQLAPGPFHTSPGAPLFGAIGDSAPDRWGRALMRRAERQRAKIAMETPRTLYEMDYLLGVDDEARQGALRFSLSRGGPFLATHKRPRIPPLIGLPKLLTASERVVNEEEDEEDLRILLGPGSSLGGARPKASVRDRKGSLVIAKFPHKEDEWNTVIWEAVALSLAARAGVTIPSWRLETIGEKPVLLLNRFDRKGKVRIPFLSAMSMLGAKDREVRSYLEIVDALRMHGARAETDIRELWRRVVLTVLMSNVDDHLRNHGFLYAGTEGWVLSPAYDLNPSPVDVRPRFLSTAIDEENTAASIDLAFSVSRYFRLSENEARDIARQVGAAVSKWREVAKGLGCSKSECDRMASAFEHRDLEIAMGK